MEIFNFEQRSHEWHAMRKELILTASNAACIATAEKGLDTYCREIVRKHYQINEIENYDNEAMKVGREREAEARNIYQLETGLDVIEVGFVKYNQYAGCSPDGLVGNDGLIEIKCPTDKIYFDLLIDGKFDSSHLWQMQMQMLCCERQWCDYFVFNPNFSKNFILKRFLKDDDMQKKLIAGFNKGVELIEFYKSLYLKEVENA